jgi:hypothetical protein
VCERERASESERERERKRESRRHQEHNSQHTIKHIRLVLHKAQAPGWGNTNCNYNQKSNPDQRPLLDSRHPITHNTKQEHQEHNNQRTKKHISLVLHKARSAAEKGESQVIHFYLNHKTHKNYFFAHRQHYMSTRTACEWTHYSCVG